MNLSTTGDTVTVNAYADASFGCHVDGKSHTGSVITLGAGSIRNRSGKQTLVSKSSTEAELIAASDELSPAVWVRNFLIAQGHDVGPVNLFQDNLSTIALIHKGRSNSSRLRHVNIRYFFIKDRIESGEVVTKSVSTEEMVADFMSKPLQGNKFREFRRMIMNLT
jgi:hypothetical protein